MSNLPIVIIGYSGHAYVAIDSLLSNNIQPLAYCENDLKTNNPYKLDFLGNENLINKSDFSFFIGIGDNKLRNKIYNKLKEDNAQLINAIHSSAILSAFVNIGDATLVGPGAIINSHAKIGNGVICNSGSIIEHECVIENFVHIAPGAILCGNVCVGENSFVGAGAVIKQGIKIGKNVVIGAGSVVVKDVKDNSIVKGNPAK